MLNQRKHFNKEALIENIGADDCFIKTLLETYFKSFEAYMDTVKNAIYNNDRELFRKTVHNIKGSSSTIYFEIMTDLFEQLERTELSEQEKFLGLITEIEKEYSFLKIDAI